MKRLKSGVKYLVDKFNFYVKVALSFLCTSSLSAAMPTFLETLIDLTEAFPGAVRRGNITNHIVFYITSIGNNMNCYIAQRMAIKS